MKNSKGFTLVELLAVISLLGALIILLIPAIGNIVNRAKSQIKDEEKKTLIDSGKIYATDLAQGDASYNVGGNIYKGYAFKEYIASIATNVNGVKKGSIEVNAEELVKDGYFDKECDYDILETGTCPAGINSSSNKCNTTCKVNKTCTLKVTFEVEEINANPECDRTKNKCKIYYDLKNYESEIVDEKKCEISK